MVAIGLLISIPVVALLIGYDFWHSRDRTARPTYPRLDSSSVNPATERRDPT